jgi:hypothetical protein
MKKIQNLMLSILKPNLGIKSIKNKNFPKYSISGSLVPEYYDNNGTITSRTTPTFRSQEFGDFYFVPKFDSTFADPTLCRVNYLVSFDSNKSNRILKWTLKFGDGKYVEGPGPTNFLLTTALTSSGTTLKGKLENGFKYLDLPSAGTVFITSDSWSGTITTNSSTSATLVSTIAGTLRTGMTLTAAGIPANTTVTVSGTNITLSNAATTSVTGLNATAGDSGEYINYSQKQHNLIGPIWSNTNYGYGTLTQRLSSSDSSYIYVSSTDNFPSSGIVMVDKEAIAYSSKSSTDPNASANQSALGTGNAILINSVTLNMTGGLLDADNDDGTIIVNSTSGFPTYCTILIDSEQIECYVYNATTFYILARGVNETNAASHANSSSVYNLTLNNIQTISGTFKVGASILDSNTSGTPVCINTGTTISAIKDSVYADGFISYSGYNVTGSGTTFTSDMVGKTLVYPDGQAAKITGQASTTSLTTDYNATASEFVVSAASLYTGSVTQIDEGKENTITYAASDKVYQYLTAAEHNIEVGDLVTTDNCGASYNLTTASVINISSGSDYSTAPIYQALAFGTEYIYFTSNPHGFADGDIVTITGADVAAYNQTFTISKIESDAFTSSLTTTSSSKTITIPSGNSAGAKVSVGQVVSGSGITTGTTVASITTDDTTGFVTSFLLSANATASAAVTLTFTPPALGDPYYDNTSSFFTVIGLTSSPGDTTIYDGLATRGAYVEFYAVGGSSSPGSSSISSTSKVTVYKKYKILTGKEFTLNKPVLSSSSSLSFWSPGVTDYRLTISSRGSNETIANDHEVGVSVGQIVNYNNVPYVSIQTHSSGKNPTTNPTYWSKISDQDLIITLKNLQRGAFTTIAASHTVNTQVNGVTPVSHYYQYDGGSIGDGSQNGAMPVNLTGIDNHNREFSYNTIVYPKTDTESNWSTNLS